MYNFVTCLFTVVFASISNFRFLSVYRIFFLSDGSGYIWFILVHTYTIIIMMMMLKQILILFIGQICLLCVCVCICICIGANSSFDDQEKNKTLYENDEKKILEFLRTINKWRNETNKKKEDRNEQFTLHFVIVFRFIYFIFGVCLCVCENRSRKSN